MAASARAKKGSSKAKDKSKAPARPAKPTSAGLPRPFSEFLGIALFAVGALIFGGLVSYQGGDGDLMGPVGHLAAAALYASFGMAAYLVAVGVIGMGIKALRGEGMEIGLSEGAGFAVATLAGCVLLHVVFPTYRVHGYTAGGLAGELVGEVMLGMFHHAGTYLVAATVMCLGLLASTPLSTAHLMRVAKVIGRGAQSVGDYLWGGAVDLVRSQRDADDEDADEDDARRREDEALEKRFDAIDEGAFEDEVDEDELEEAENEDEVEEDDEELEEDDEGEDELLEDEASAASNGRKKNKGRARKVTGQRAASAATSKSTSTSTSTSTSKSTSKSTSTSKSKKANRRRGGDPDNVVGQELEVDLPVGKAGKGKAEPKAAAEAAPEEVPEIVLKVDEDEVKPKAVPAKKAPPRPEQLAKQPAPAPAAQNAGDGKQGIPGLIRLTDGAWELPPLQLFEAAEKIETEIDRGFVLEQAQRLVTALGEFKIRGKVTKIHPGPVITRYEFKPEPGTKLSRIESLENDLAMALEAIRIRILAPIPGKATVGFEVPNKTRETVYIKEILGQDNFGGKQRLPLALGKDITGTITVTDLAKAPHLLVAGATGSGKSVGVNSMICSLLYTCSPEDVRMIMIDPKMLELSIYEGIPHLLLPVVTDPEKAALALRWAVHEMERRYQLLSTAQVRDIAGYNKKLSDLVKAWEVETKQIEARRRRGGAATPRSRARMGPTGREAAGRVVRRPGQSHPHRRRHRRASRQAPTRLPYVVVIIDEFADLMMVASKEVEQSVARIAAKARAAGIHLIVATQRPSVDVITGTIKNNFPSRIAFQVTSDADSRTILDGKGAKQLLGMGDMLHMDRGSEVNRVHGCFVSEDEILEVVKFVKKQAKPVYNMDIVRKTDDGDAGGPSTENMDPLYDKGVQIVAEAQKVSTSMLQRRLGIGYNRAAKIVEAMEEQGVIGPSRGTTPREVYVSPA